MTTDGNVTSLFAKKWINTFKSNLTQVAYFWHYIATFSDQPQSELVWVTETGATFISLVFCGNFPRYLSDYFVKCNGLHFFSQWVEAWRYYKGKIIKCDMNSNQFLMSLNKLLQDVTRQFHSASGCLSPCCGVFCTLVYSYTRLIA